MLGFFCIKEGAIRIKLLLTSAFHITSVHHKTGHTQQKWIFSSDFVKSVKLSQLGPLSLSKLLASYKRKHIITTAKIKTHKMFEQQRYSYTGFDIFQQAWWPVYRQFLSPPTRETSTVMTVPLSKKQKQQKKKALNNKYCSSVAYISFNPNTLL